MGVQAGVQVRSAGIFAWKGVLAHEKCARVVCVLCARSAEFAKEAMAQQRVPGSDMDGFLDVRWANEDPNPRAQARVKREHASAFSQVSHKEVLLHDNPCT